MTERGLRAAVLLLLSYLATAAALLAVWESVARLVGADYLPGPITVLPRLVSLLADPSIWLALAASFNFLGVFCYVGAAPALILDHWKLSETQFIWLFLPVIAGFTVGAMLSGRLAGRIPAMRQAGIGFALIVTTCTLRLLLHGLFAEIPIYVQQIALLLSGIATQLVFPVLTLRMLDLFPQARGSAASMQSFVALTLASLMAGVLVPLAQASLMHLALLSALSVWLGLVFWEIERRLSGPAV